jgi:hypothetical protein
MVRAMQQSAVGEGLIARLVFDEPVITARVRQRLDRAEAHLPHPPRDSRARAAQGYAQRRLRAAADVAIAAGRDPEADLPWLRAASAFLRAHAAVLAAEPAEYRDFLPLHLRHDPFTELEAVIESYDRKVQATIDARREKEVISAKRSLAKMTTADYARLSPVQQADMLGTLGIILPGSGPTTGDASGRGRAPVEAADRQAAWNHRRRPRGAKPDTGQ